MSQDRPTAAELLVSVREFLEQKLLPEAQGGRAFHLRVAANILGIVERELTEGPRLDREEQGRLVQLLGQEGELEALNRLLCARIRDGSLDLSSAALRDHLWQTTRAKLEVANPRYK